jgi:hypothetical protein
LQLVNKSSQDNGLEICQKKVQRWNGLENEGSFHRYNIRPILAWR